MPIESDAEASQSREIPPHLDRWNWGAFFLNWIWGIGNSVWIALLCFVPIVGLVMIFVLGARGSRWAWRNRLWRDEEHFRRTQRIWAIAGLVVWMAVPVLIGGGMVSIFGALKHSEAYQMSMAEIRANPAVTAALGDRIKDGYFVTGHVQLNGAQGRAAFQIPLKGERGSATAYSQVVKQAGVWEIRLLFVRVEGKSEPIVIINRGHVPLPGGPLST